MRAWRDGVQGPRPWPFLLLDLAQAAWSGGLRAARAMPATLGLCAAVLFAATWVTLYTAGSPSPWPVTATLCAATILWTQGVLTRLVLRHLMVGDDGGVAAFLPVRSLRSVIGVLLLTQIIAVASPGLMIGALYLLKHEVGPVSTWLSVPLLLPLALLGLACALRLSLAAAPAALNLSAPLADSWDITDGHTLFMAGACIMAMGPLFILALLGVRYGPSGTAVQAIGLTAVVLALSGAQAGLMVGFYQRWQTVLRPDMRPSRNRTRRREPLIVARPR